MLKKNNLENKASTALKKYFPEYAGIKLATAENAILSEINQAVFRHWFVDFEFPDKNGKSYASNGGKMVDVEFGKIPNGWEVTTLGEVTDVIDCLHSKKPTRIVHGKNFLQLCNIKDYGLLDMSDPYFITEEDYKKWISRIEAVNGDCVITNVGRVGAVAQIPYGFKAALGRNMTAIRCKLNNNMPTFLIEYLISQEFKKEINKKIDTGTILDALNVRNIPKLRIVLPPKDIIAEYESFSYPIRRIMEINLKQKYQKYL